MKKFLMGGVSLFAILSANNAIAAGYTCEELIEYTSCMQGYYLDKDAVEVCPDGYHEMEAGDGVCVEADGYVYDSPDRYDCEDIDDTYTWRAKGCLDESEEHYAPLQQVINASTCLTCPTGYTCDGGTTQPYVGACDAGYTKHTLCPAGYSDWGTGCAEGYWYNDGSFGLGHKNGDSEEECLANGNDWFENYCVDEYGEELVPPLVAGPTCGKCPAGYLCAGGNAAAVTCPAGSYCADAGASVATGKCNIGTYSSGGATAATCTSCPATGLTDKDGKIVVATTAETGATTVAACIIGDKVEFQDTKGIYHFKSNCAYEAGFDASNASEEEKEERCEELGGSWEFHDGFEEYFCDASFNENESEEACTSIGGDWVEADEGMWVCVCGDYSSYYNLNTGKVSCF